MKKEHDLNPVMEPAANDSKTAFHVMTKPIGPLCNLDCTYCFYLEKENLYPQAQKRAAWSMQDDVLETYIRQYIASQDTPVVSFAWQGGEPTLLGVEYFRKVVALQKEYADGRKVENAFQTNGVILDDTWCAFFAEHNFLIGLSIDGPRTLHDRYRVDKGGQPTFDRVIQGLSYLKKHDVAFNTLTVVQRHNGDYPLEVYRFLKEIGSGFMQFIPIVERVATEPGLDHLSLVSPDFTSEAVVSEWSVEPEQYGRFLCTVFDEWVRNDVGQYFVQLFDVALESWIGRQPGLCVFRETCGDALALEHNGDLYSCDHFVYPAHKLGNIMDKPLLSMTHSFQQQSFGAAKQDTLPDYCRRCDVRFACNGECPKKRFMKTPDGEAGLNYLCAGYKMFFRHIDPYMRFMAGQLYQRRAPADVMAWSRWQDFHASGGRTGRNKPCPCSSGRKYKVCCGTSRNGGDQLAGSA